MVESKKEKYLEQRKLLMEERKKEVIETAKKLFLEKGLNNVTMNDLMIEAGLSKATMYRYYDSIHPIAFEVEYEMIQEIFADLRLVDVSNRSGGDALKEILLILVDRFVVHIKAYRYISMFDFLYTDQYPNDNLSQEYNKVIQSIIKANISGEKVKEQFDEALTYVSVIFAYLQKLAHRKEILDKGEIDVIERLDIVKKMIHQLLK
jgi:AcrR family transcriptional regulator